MPTVIKSDSNDDIADAFDFIIDDEDEIEVELEVIASMENGRKIPKVIERTVLEQTKETLATDLGKIQDSLKQGDTLSPTERISLERDVAVLTEALQRMADTLNRPSTKIKAVFQRADMEKDGAIYRESHIQTFNGAETEKQWDSVAHVKAVLKHCLKSWTLKQRKGDKSVPVPINAYSKLGMEIPSAFVTKFKDISQYGVNQEIQSKNS